MGPAGNVPFSALQPGSHPDVLVRRRHPVSGSVREPHLEPSAMVPAAVDVTTILFPLTTLLPLTILFQMFFLLPLRALPQPVATSNLPPILFQLDSSEVRHPRRRTPAMAHTCALCGSVPTRLVKLFHTGMMCD